MCSLVGPAVLPSFQGSHYVNARGRSHPSLWALNYPDLSDVLAHSHPSEADGPATYLFVSPPHLFLLLSIRRGKR